MNRFIKIGGVSIIVVVFGIFIFILWQVLPLFQGAKVSELKTVQAPPGEYRALAMDEYSEAPILVDQKGKLWRVNLEEGGAAELENGLPDGFDVTAVSYEQKRQDLAVGSAKGEVAIVDLQYELSFEDGQRVVSPSASAGPVIQAGSELPILQLSYGDSGEQKAIALIQGNDEEREVHVALLTQKRTLFGAGEIEVGEKIELTDQVEGVPDQVIVSSSADSVYVSTRAGEILYFIRQGGEFALRQKLAPFADLPNPRISLMSFLLGDVSLVLVSETGVNRIYSLYIPEPGAPRQLGLTKQFPPLARSATAYAASSRNKSFFVAGGASASLRFGTAADVRWEAELPYQIKLARISGKYDRIALLDEEHRLHTLELDDPHPEASFRALFGKVWYEGYSGPAYAWQSTGGSDDFEPKLSMIPLIYGTLKGTFYAMMFALPISLLAAVYTSQFASRSFRAYIKPLMEIMASLPSVVLGFLAALWLAPLIENRVPSILLAVIVIPLVAVVFGWIWSILPVRYRVWIRPGYEFLVFAPVFLAASYVCWNLGPWFESLVFVVNDPTTGQSIADFRLWWPVATGADFQQRNSLVVGFAMGFAVIPIIFTIAEDSLSNVPQALASGSLALGASRWQTALRIILPTASAGIFSAVMIGLGRAVGETMIVVMATGNTPIMDLNIFSGMRTLSANIAVELPEAPHHGTLYRTLFLGALVLFMMTFVVNTLAEILRQRLREKYKLT